MNTDSFIPSLMKTVAPTLLCLAFLLTCTQQSTPAREGMVGVATRCDAKAFVIDADPNGLNVRSGPSKDAKIIGNLPNQSVEGIVVHITGSEDNWLEIDAADEAGGETDRSFFHGQGWVFAPLLGVSGIAIDHGGTNIYESASRKAKIVGRVPGGNDGVKIRACEGKWLRVEYKGMIGWAAPDTLCSNPLTTCA